MNRNAWSNVSFFATLGLLAGVNLALIVGALAADAFYVWFHRADSLAALLSAEILAAARLSIVSSLVTTILALWVAIPTGYLLSRVHFRHPLLRIVRASLDAILDIPIILPPLVVGVSLLILFRTDVGKALDAALAGGMNVVVGVLNAVTGADLEPPTGFTYAVPGVILAQFMVSAAFAVRTMRTAFDEITTRKEQVAQTLGCTRAQAFWHVVLPEARGGIVTAATITWARAIGEFGPILVFAGATPMRTQVLPTSVFLQMSVGDLTGAVAVSLLMVGMAVTVLVVVRVFIHRDLAGRSVRD